MSSDAYKVHAKIIAICLSVVLLFIGCAQSTKRIDNKNDHGKLNKDKRLTELKKLYQEGQYDRVITKADTLKKSKDPEIRKKANFYLYKAKHAQLLEEKNLLKKQVELGEEKMLLDVDKAALLPEEKPKRSRGEIEETPGLGGSISLNSEKSQMHPKIRKKLLQKVGTINLVDADLDFLLHEIFKSTGVNVLADVSILKGKKITIRVRDETVEDILAYLSEQYDLEFIPKGNAIYLTDRKNVDVKSEIKEKLETRVYRLNKGLNESKLVRDFTALSDLSFVQSLSMSSSGGGGGGTGMGMGTGMGAGMGMGMGMDSSMGGMGMAADSGRISKVSGELGKKSSIEVILENIHELLDWPAGSKLLLDRKRNIVIIRTTLKVHKEIAALLKEFDKDPIQVVIEARYIEVSNMEDFDFGINFNLQGDFGKTQLGSSGTFFDIPFSEPSSATGGSSILLSGVLNKLEYQAILFLLDRSEKITTISSPKVTTTNNSQATIAVATNVPFVEDYDVVTSGVSDVEASASGNVVVSQPALKANINDQNFEGIALNVTPSVGADAKTINLVIQPVVRTVVDEETIQDAALIEDVTVPSITRPIIESRVVNTQLIIEDGNTVVLGGQITRKHSFTRQQTPFLGDIPILGNLFKRKKRKEEKTHLLIFVTAHILSPTGQGYVN